MNEYKNNLLLLFLAVILAVEAYSLWGMAKVSRETLEKKQYFDSVFHELRRFRAADSLQSIRENRAMDSIALRIERVQAGYDAARVELRKLRQSNEKMRHRLDSLMPAARPEF